ncbi:MAG: NDP-sugar synthase, partial [Actinomycetota bacterium]|nr:NDP-sugar synthase [Actinomycetota bacterium]
AWGGSDAWGSDAGCPAASRPDAGRPRPGSGRSGDVPAVTTVEHPVRAVVLVGGQGTRLRPLTLTTPKQMLPVAGRPMIERVVAHLGAHGISDVVLSLGYRPDAFLAAYPDGTCAGVGLHYAVEDHPLDTAGAIAFAARHAGIIEPFVVVNGDVVTGLDVAALINLHRTRRAEATIALTPVDDPSAFGVVPTDGSGRVTAFIEKPPRDQAPTNLINAGTYVLEPSVLNLIVPGRPTSIERETFPVLVGRGCLYAMASDAPWIDAGTPEAYRRINLSWAERYGGSVHPEAFVADDACVERSVVGAGSVIAPGAVVTGSVLLDGVRVGPGAIITDAVIGYRGTIGAGAGVGEGSVLGDDAVIDDGVMVAAGEVPGGPTQPPR